MRFYQAVNNFLGDTRVQSARDLSRETRSLRICYPKEVPVSRFLAWLLDPTQGHGLQDGVLRALFIAAWSQSSEVPVDDKVARFLSPTSVEAQSFDDCLVEREVRLDGRMLDVLVLEPRRKWLLAIEHKFGARESRGQLAHYRRALEAQFPNWTRVLVFLDSGEKQPTDEGWIGLSYDWLVRELKTAESSPWLGEVCRGVIRDFRHAVDSDAREFEHIASAELLKITTDHRPVIERMKEWSEGDESFTALAARLFATSGCADSEAGQQLFKVFWQRRNLWEQCIPMLSYGPFLAAAQSAFGDVEHLTERKCIYFRLPQWRPLDALDHEEEDHEEVWALGVSVRPLANEPGSYGVMPYVVPGWLRNDLRTPAVLERVQTLRLESMRKRTIQADAYVYPLKAEVSVAAADVGRVLVEHLRLLDRLARDLKEIAAN